MKDLKRKCVVCLTTSLLTCSVPVLGGTNSAPSPNGITSTVQRDGGPIPTPPRRTLSLWPNPIDTMLLVVMDAFGM